MLREVKQSGINVSDLQIEYMFEQKDWFDSFINASNSSKGGKGQPTSGPESLIPDLNHQLDLSNLGQLSKA